MPLWCNTCRCDVSAPCTSHHLAESHSSSSFCRKFRSTKGASKARRDHINHEIRNMRALLPVAREDRERLSYLHSMAAICTYIRKSVLLKGLPAGERPGCPLPYEAFLPALHGFLLLTTAQGRLVYVSENVAEYLGLSMVDVLQGDTFYDLVESCDVAVVKSNLDLENNPSPERSFVCRMHTSKTFKLQRGSCRSVMVRGTFQSLPRPGLSSPAVDTTTTTTTTTTSQPLFVALCTPTVNQLQSSDSHLCSTFYSAHRMDMTFTQLSDSVSYLLGRSAEEMTGRSWYGLIHPEDLSLSAASHRSLMQADEGLQVEMVLRLQRKDLSWAWIYVRANKDSERQGLSCTNFIVSETEARYLRTTVSSDAFRPSSPEKACNAAAPPAPHAPSHDGAGCLKRPRASDGQSEEPPGARARRGSEPDSCHVPCASCQSGRSPVPPADGAALFTPPYSPASSGSPPQQEDLGHDPLMDVQGCADLLLSSPEVSPVYYSHPGAALACHRSPSGSLPAVDEPTFDFDFVHSPLSSPSPTRRFQACASDARSVPDCLSAYDARDVPADCVLHGDDFCLLLQPPQGGGLDQVQHVPGPVPPTRSGLLAPSPESRRYSRREQAEISILAQQISSLASSFAMSHALNTLQNALPPACDWAPSSPPPLSPGLPPKCELLLLDDDDGVDDGVFDSLLDDLDGPRPWEPEGKPLFLPPAAPEDPLPAEPFAVVAGFSLQLGRHDPSSGLHQLGHYVPSGLQRGGLAAENLR